MPDTDKQISDLHDLLFRQQMKIEHLERRLSGLEGDYYDCRVQLKRLEGVVNDARS